MRTHTPQFISRARFAGDLPARLAPEPTSRRPLWPWVLAALAALVVFG